MKLLRVKYDNNIYFGALEGGDIRLLKNSIYADEFQFTDITLPADRAKLLSPVAPSKIVCAGLNYKDHAKELNMDIPEDPTLFLKPSTAVIGHGDDIIYPESVTRLDYEAELAVVIKKQAKDVNKESVFDYILGYTCLNDVTARDLQKKDIQWTRAKSFDTFAPVGPYIITGIDPSDLSVRSYVNGKARQSSSTSDMIFDVGSLVCFISRVMTLLPGDVIATGTPKGVGELQRGDSVVVEVESIGELKNKVI